MEDLGRRHARRQGVAQQVLAGGAPHDRVQAPEGAAEVGRRAVDRPRHVLHELEVDQLGARPERHPVAVAGNLAGGAAEREHLRRAAGRQHHRAGPVGHQFVCRGDRQRADADAVVDEEVDDGRLPVDLAAKVAEAVGQDRHHVAGVTAALVGDHAVGARLGPEARVAGVVPASPVRVGDQSEAPALDLQQPFRRLVRQNPGHAGVGHPEGGPHDVPVMRLRRVVRAAAAVGRLPGRAIGAFARVVRRAGAAERLLEGDDRPRPGLGRSHRRPRRRGAAADDQDIGVDDRRDRGCSSDCHLPSSGRRA